MRRFFSIAAVLVGLMFVGTGLGVAETPKTESASSMSSAVAKTGEKQEKTAQKPKPKTHKRANVKKAKPVTSSKPETGGKTGAPVRK